MAPRPYPGAIRAATPLFIPTLPFALVLGVAIHDSAMPEWLGWSSNIVIFAGSAQLVTVTLAATSTWLTIVATATVVNLRHAMYSAALAPRFRNQPRWFRWLGPWVLIDQTFVIVSDTPHLDDDEWRRFYLTGGLFFLAVWTAAVTIGIFAGSAIPTAWRLGVAPAIMFAGLVVLGATSRPAIVAAVTGAGVCLVSLGVPNNGGILIGALAGVVAGYLADRRPTSDTDAAAEPTGTADRREQEA